MTPLKDLVVGDARRAIVVLFAAVWLVLLVACANAAHLLLSRAAARGRELAVRAALGATRARIAAQLLTENLLIAAIAGVAGLVLARGFIGVFKLLGAASIPRVQAIELDARVAGFAALLAVAHGAGVRPAAGAAAVAARPDDGSRRRRARIDDGPPAPPAASGADRVRGRARRDAARRRRAARSQFRGARAPSIRASCRIGWSRWSCR